MAHWVERAGGQAQTQRAGTLRQKQQHTRDQSSPRARRTISQQRSGLGAVGETRDGKLMAEGGGCGCAD